MGTVGGRLLAETHDAATGDDAIARIDPSTGTETGRRVVGRHDAMGTAVALDAARGILAFALDAEARVLFRPVSGW